MSEVGIDAMKFTKSPPEMVELFEAVVPGPPAVRRSMFGFPAAFLNGNMFMGLHQDALILRLGTGAEALLKLPGARVFEPMPGRPMREYVVVPPSLYLDHDGLRKWVAQSLEYAASLKPKGKSAKKSPTAPAKSKPRNPKKAKYAGIKLNARATR